MNRKGFTLIELLGVLVILSIVLLIALPNISAILTRSKNDSYLADAKKLVTSTEYEIRKGTINKPASNQLVKVTLNYLDTGDIETSPEGEEYNLNNSYVIIARVDGYLKYYVNLVTDTGKGISLVDSEELSSDERNSLISSNVIALSEDKIIEVVYGEGYTQTVTFINKD